MELPEKKLTHKKNPRYELWRWQIFAVTWLAYFGFYLTRKTFAVAKIGIGSDPSMNLTVIQMAWIDGAYMMAYAVGQFIWGMAGDKSGTRKVILIGMLCSVLASIAMGASSITITLGVFFCLQGIFQASGWAPLIKNVGNFFSRNERGTIMGLWCTCYAFGGMVASIYAGYWGDKLGWRYAFFIPAVTLLGIWLIFFIFQRNRPEDVGLPSIEEYHAEKVNVIKDSIKAEEDKEGSWKTIRKVISSPNVLILSVSYFLIKPMRYAILFWGPKYINDKLGSGMTESGLISSLFEFAGIFSIFIGGYVSDRVFNARRIPVCVLCLVSLGIFLFFMDNLPSTRFFLGASYLLFGLLVYAPDSIICGVAAVDFGTKKGASTASGFVNGAGSIGAIVGVTIPGFFSQRWGWDGVLTLLGFMTLIAGILLLPKWYALPVEKT